MVGITDVVPVSTDMSHRPQPFLEGRGDLLLSEVALLLSNFRYFFVFYLYLIVKSDLSILETFIILLWIVFI